MMIFTQHGQSSTEYLIVCAALALILGIGLSDSSSLLWQWISALQTAYQKFSFSLSIPI